MDSILTQTFQDLELICLDDGSTDRSWRILKEYVQADPRVRIASRTNAGVVKTANDLHHMARGRYIARMDADDISEPTRLEKQAAVLENHDHVVAVGCGYKRTDPYGVVCQEVIPPLDHASIDARMLNGHSDALVIGAAMWRADTFTALGGLRALEPIDDLDLFLRMAEVGELANIDEPLYQYRRHLNSVCVRLNQALRERILDVVHDAYDRRKIPGPRPTFEQLRPDLQTPPDSDAEHIRNWALHAIKQGHQRLALRHAFDALRREPFSGVSWRVLRWAATCR